MSDADTLVAAAAGASTVATAAVAGSAAVAVAAAAPSSPSLAVQLSQVLGLTVSCGSAGEAAKLRAKFRCQLHHLLQRLVRLVQMRVFSSLEAACCCCSSCV